MCSPQLLARSAALLTLCALPAAAQFPAPAFDAPWLGYRTAQYPDGLVPSASALVDLDGDGHLDVAVVSGSANPQLALLWNDGTGAFSAPDVQAMPGPSMGVAANDIDGDGDLDIVVGHNGIGAPTHLFSLLLNEGGRTFGAPASFPIGGFPTEVTVVDLTGDGLDDVVAVVDGAVAMARSLGNGQFFAPTLSLVAGGARSIDVADIDEDGDLDAVVGHTTGRLSVLENSGFGFLPAVEYVGLPANFFNQDTSIALGDVDGDGDLDVLLSGEGVGLGVGGLGYGSIGFFRNLGGTSYGPVETLPLVPSEDGALDMEFVDANGDGHLDILAALGRRVWVLLPGDGTGAFGAPVEIATGGAVVAVMSGDLDGDDDLDVVALSGDSAGICVHVNAGGFATPSTFPMIDPAGAPSSASELALVDVDLDGELDAIVGWAENFGGVFGIGVRRGNGDGSFAPTETYPTPKFPEFLTAGDLNADGLPDLVYSDGWNGFPAQVHVRLNQGAGVFGPAQDLPGPYCEQAVRIELADVNADGAVDILFYDCTDRLYSFPGDGTGGFAAPVQQSFPFTQHGLLAVGDLDGDGLPDVVTDAGLQGRAEVRFGTGTGQFVAPVTLDTGRGVSAAEVVDFDGDGVLDVVAAFDLDGSGVSVVPGDPLGGFSAGASFPGTAGGGLGNLAVGDVDGDGRVDVVVANDDSGELSRWRQAEAGSLAAEERYGVGQAGADVELGDLNGDGRLDAVVRTRATPGAGWYYPELAVLLGATPAWTGLGQGLAGTHGEPELTPTGAVTAGANVRLEVDNALANTTAYLVAGASAPSLPFLGGTLVPSVDVLVPFPIGPDGAAALVVPWPKGTQPGFVGYLQVWLLDPGAPFGGAATHAVSALQH